MNVLEELSKTEAESTPARPRKGSAAKLVVAGGVLLLIAVAAVALYLHFRDRVSSDDAQVDGPIVPISSKISGSVLEVLVKNNQPVKTGQVLVRIDPRDYQAKVDMAKAAVLQAESQLRSAQVVVPLTNETTQSSASGAS